MGKASAVIRFEVIIFGSEDGRASTAEVPELPGWAAKRRSCQEALANEEAVITELIEATRRKD